MSRSTDRLFVGVNYELTFGRHKGKLLGDLLENDYEYIVWLSQKEILKIDPYIVKMALDKCEEDCDDWYIGFPDIN